MAAKETAELVEEATELHPRPLYTDKLGPVPQDEQCNSPLAAEPSISQATKDSKNVPMKWTSERLIALVKALRHHHVWDPDMKKHGDMQKVYATILAEEPWRSISGLAGWRPLYAKGLEVAKEYAVAIEREKLHTGGGQPPRPDWWKNCEKELDTLANWRLTAATKREDISTQQAEEEEKKQLTDTALAEHALIGLGKRRSTEQSAGSFDAAESSSEISPARARSRKASRDEAIAVIKSLAAPQAMGADELQLRKDELALKKDELALKREELALARVRAESEFELRKQELNLQAELRKEEVKTQRELLLRFAPKS